MSARKSSSGSRWLALPFCVLLTTGLGGCVDYLKHSDTVTFGAGEAQAWNKTVHIADPWPPYAANTQIPGDGQRTAVVMQRYSTGNAAGTAQAGENEAVGAPGVRP